MGIHVSDHAVMRYQQRVALVSAKDARAAIIAVSIKAVEFGAHYVRLGTGQRIVIDGSTVITVLPADYRSSALDPRKAQFHAL